MKEPVCFSSSGKGEEESEGKNWPSCWVWARCCSLYCPHTAGRRTRPPAVPPSSPPENDTKWNPASDSCSSPPGFLTNWLISFWQINTELKLKNGVTLAHLVKELLSRCVGLDGKLQLCIHGGHTDVDLEKQKTTTPCLPHYASKDCDNTFNWKVHSLKWLMNLSF